jgi:hypothetical protein
MTNWKPEYENIYWFVTDYLEVDYCYYINTYKDIDRYEFGNMFQTEEQAQRALEMVKETLLKCHKEIDNG